jgi:hypothetical protein
VTQTPTPPHEPHKDPVVRVAWINGGFGVLVTLIGLAAGVATGLVKPGPVISGTTSVRTVVRTVTRTTGGDAAAQDDTNGTTTPAAAGFRTRRASGDDPLTLSRGYGADVDSMALDWEVGSGRTDDRYDLAFVGGGLLQANNGSDLAVVSAGSDAARTCAAATGYVKQLTADELKPDTALCVRTTEKRLASMTVTKLDPDSLEAITLDVTVWDPPES